MDYKCNICSKQYKNYKVLWEHNKKFHKQQLCNAITTDNKTVYIKK